MTEIVKVQRPLATNDAALPWLIYDRNRRHVAEVPQSIIPAHVRKAMGKSAKAYFVGAWSSIVGWGLSMRVADQDW